MLLFQRFIKNGLVRLSAALLLALWVVDQVSRGFTVWDWVQHWRDALQWVHSEYFIWAVAFTTVGTMAWGVRQVIRAEKETAPNLEAVLAAEADARAKALEGVHALAKYYFDEQRHKSLATQLDDYESKVQTYADVVDQFTSGGVRAVDPMQPNHLGGLTFTSATNAMQPLGQRFAADGVHQPTMQHPSPHLDAHPPANGAPVFLGHMVHTFDPAQNKSFIDNHLANVRLMQKHVFDMRQAFQRQSQALATQQRNMEAKLVPQP